MQDINRCQSAADYDLHHSFSVEIVRRSNNLKGIQPNWLAKSRKDHGQPQGDIDSDWDSVGGLKDEDLDSPALEKSEVVSKPLKNDVSFAPFSSSQHEYI